MDFEFIYGKNRKQRIVGIEINDDQAELFIETDNGVKVEFIHNEFWILYHKNYTGNFIELDGGLHYSYAMKYNSMDEYKAARYEARNKRWDVYDCYNDKERFMLKSGVTMYKGMKIDEVSVLSFDIETTGLTHDKDSRVLLISNTYKKGNKIERRLFSFDNYDSQHDLILAWCNWVNKKDPSIILGHNILGFDLPYLDFVANGELPIGRDKSNVKFADYVSQFRKDGSQSYDYKRVNIYGREVIDTFHLSIKYDIGRKYDSYSLKQIIKQEGLERDDRQHYDASKIRENYENKDEWEKIKEYAIHDADDALNLYELMAPSYFYYTQHIPKTFQQIINGASGSQVNAFMVRSYLQDSHSLPKASEREEYEGAISFGNPGVYKHVNKVDVASLYPSIILKDKLYDKDKDPKGYFLEMVTYFTKERLSNKQLAKESKERYYSDLEQSQKIFINSAYGFMGASGLLFNSPEIASQITRTGREILQQGIAWAETKGYQIINADTDSFSYSTGKKNSHFDEDILELNKLNEGIVWEDDGQFKTFIVVKAKNYVLDDGKKVKIKGSSLKATMKEPALREFIRDVIDCLLKNRKDELYDLYMDYCFSINNISTKSIDKWCSKKTVTKSVLHPSRTNEQKILEAIREALKRGAVDQIKEGDKIHIYFETADKLRLKELFDGEIDQAILYKKLYKTLDIFNTIIDVSLFPNLALKRNEHRRPVNRDIHKLEAI